MKFKDLVLACALVTCGTQAHASVITTPGAPYIPFANLDVFTAGPVTVAPGITWTSTNTANQGGSVYGWTQGYGFAANGYDFENLVGLNDSNDAYGVVDSMTFAFDTPVSSVGAFLNWVPSQSPTTIAVYDSAHALIESLVVSQGGANLVAPNSFYGFHEGSANISYFTLSDGYVAALSGLNGNVITGSPAPEPATWGMLIMGFAMIGGALRTRAKATLSYS